MPAAADREQVNVSGDQSDFGYYRAKTEQERIYLGAQVDARVVRATQFHDFVATFCHLAPFDLATALAGIRFQPIAVEDVARALVDQATDTAPTRQRTGGAAPPSRSRCRGGWATSFGRG